MVSKRAKEMLAQVGLSPSDVKNHLESSADIASRLVVATLDSILDDLIATSESGSLVGYQAVRIETKHSPVRLRRANEVIPEGVYSWVITVLPSKNHLDIGLNVFNILDSGRDPLTGEGPFPMWGLQGGRRIPGGQVRRPSGQFGGIVQPAINVSSAIRREPRSIPSKKKDSGEVLVFAKGPIAGVQPLNLYDQALKISKKGVSGLFRGVWDVILVGNIEEVI